jgi:hypothetical protein
MTGIRLLSLPQLDRMVGAFLTEDADHAEGIKREQNCLIVNATSLEPPCNCQGSLLTRMHAVHHPKELDS